MTAHEEDKKSDFESGFKLEPIGTCAYSGLNDTIYRDPKMPSDENAKVCRALLKLTPKLHIFKHRVEFVQLAFKHGLVPEITSYSLWDRYEGLGEREFDTCFEMGDSADVIAELIKTARAEGFIDSVRSWCGEQSFISWCSYADRQGLLF